MKEKNSLGGILLVAISAISFGFIPIFAKIAYAAGTSTYTLLFLRFLTATVFMFALAFLKKLPLPSKKERLNLFLLGGLGYVGQSLCYFTALNHASASLVSLLLYTFPALVMIGSAIFFKEKITVTKIISLILALTGACVIVKGDIYAKPIGIVIAVLSAVFYAVYILLSSKIVKEGSGIVSSAFIMLGAAVVYGLINVFVGFAPPSEPKGFIGVVLLALVSTVIAFGTFFAGMEHTGPTVASLVSNLEPVVTVIASVLILSEKLTTNVVIGGILVFLSLIVTTIQKPNKEN